MKLKTTYDIPGRAEVERLLHESHLARRILMRGIGPTAAAGLTCTVLTSLIDSTPVVTPSFARLPAEWA